MTDLFGLDRYRDLFDLLFSRRTKEDPMTTRFRLKLRELGMTPDAVIDLIADVTSGLRLSYDRLGARVVAVEQALVNLTAGRAIESDPAPAGETRHGIAVDQRPDGPYQAQCRCGWASDAGALDDVARDADQHLVDAGVAKPADERVQILAGVVEELRELGMTPDAVIEASRLLRELGIEPCVVWSRGEEDEPEYRPEDHAGVTRRVKDAALPVDRVAVAGDVIDVALGPHARLTPCRVSAVSPFDSPTRWLVVDVPALIDGAELPEVRPGSHYLEVERGASWELVSDVGTVRAPKLAGDDDELDDEL